MLFIRTGGGALACAILPRPEASFPLGLQTQVRPQLLPAPAALEGKVASASENSTFTAGPVWELTSCSAGGEQPLSTTWDLKTTGCLLRASGCGLLQAQRPALQLLFHPLGMFQGLK